MSFKVFTIVLLGLLAVNQIQSAAVQDKDSNKETVVQILSIILQVSEELLDKANEIIDDVSTHQAEYKEKILDLFNTYGKKLNALVLQLVDTLREEATDNGKAVIDCFDAQQEKTEAAFSKIYGKVGDCVAAEATAILEQVKLIVKQLTDLKVDVEDKVDKLDRCTDEDMKCLAVFLNEAVDVGKRILDVVQEDLDKVLKNVLNIVKDVQKCAEPIIPEVKHMVQTIFNDFSTCARK